MAKFCSNCSAASADDAQVCGICGTPFTTAPVEQAAPTKKNPLAGIKLDDAKKAELMKYGKFAVPVVAVILVLIIIFAAIVPNVGYKSTINKFLNAIEKADAEKYMEYCNSYKFDNNYYDEDYIEDMLDKYIELYELQYGENIKLSFKVEDCDKLTEDILEEIQDSYENSEDCDDMEITKGYDIIGTLTIKGKDMDRDFENISFVLIKEDGKWKIWDSYDYSELIFALMPGDF